MSMYKDKVILVTGGTGSIGSEIVRQVLKHDPKQVRIFSRDETKQAEMQHDIKDSKLRFLIGDIRDKERVKFAMQNVDVVFHAAALKHVNLCEYNPFEAVKTNVLGTQNLIEEALKANVERFVNISTDKVSVATNTMGATKLLAERLTIAANMYRGPRRTVFACVRFGNVIDSRGSALNLFKKQIEKGLPVTVTEPEMTRFVMSVAQAARLVLKAGESMEGGETFILKMPALRLGDMVETLVESYAPKVGRDPSSIDINVIGIRPGEKIHENLISPEEAGNVVDLGEMYVLLPPIAPLESSEHKYFKMPRGISGEYSSKSTRPLTKDEIRNFFTDHSIA